METTITVYPGYRIKENWLDIVTTPQPDNNISIKTKDGWKFVGWKPSVEEKIVNDDPLSEVKISTQFKGTTKNKKGGYHGVVLTLDNRAIMSSDIPRDTRKEAAQDIATKLEDPFYVALIAKILKT